MASSEEKRDEQKNQPQIENNIFGKQNVKDYSQDVFKEVVKATQKGNAFASLLEEFPYWSSFPEFNEQCKEIGDKILNEISELFRHNAVQCGWTTTSRFVDTEERFERLVDGNDIMLESLGTFIDEANGVKKNEKPLVPLNAQSTPIVSSWNKQKNKNSGQSSFKLLLAKNIQRPQLKWLDKIDNSNTPFTPYIKTKPNAIKPLEEDEMSTEPVSDAVDNFIKQARKRNASISAVRHPYEHEISEFEPSEDEMERKDAQMYKSLDETEFHFVETNEQLTEMHKHLLQAHEVAIDLEHHSYRSFQGFVCLMQISTREKDFVVDTLALRDELYILNEVFTDPKILKVLHGADMDIGWLMRDFGLYIVNMFDTGQAARTLQEDRFSLAHLLKKHCDVNAQKQYQLADWRIRPLPEEMVRYAREDTHYLLYIYDCMRNQLMDRGNEMKNLIRSVYSKSASICLSLYEKPRFFTDSHWMAYQKYRGRLNQQQLECFRLLYEWRDKISREEDESYGYSLPNHMMFQIAENLPKEPPGVIACCNPVPPLVKQHLIDVHRLVLKAREYDPAENLQVTSDTSRNIRHEDSYDIDSRLDTGKTGFEIYSIIGPKIEQRIPALSAFEAMEHIELTEGKRKAKELLSILTSPFQQYLPNTGVPVKHPDQINKKWKEAITTKTTESPKIPTIEIESSSDDNVKLQSGNKKRKSDESEQEVQEVTIREMISGKRQKTSDDEMTYEDTVKDSSEYVPFDYSKANMRKFAANKKKNSQTEKPTIIQEPNKGKAMKTKVKNKSANQTMSFQR
ncbi:exosome complex component 10-like isoform X2 [Clytia hemisphaerica]|uniref:Exosome complex component 10 n=1 Tax=Clytia hemisphaerica TaxID=252671 RepID=A0A7M5X161_9CNID